MLPSGIEVPISVFERFQKLYRKLHNLFISKELTHVGDVTLAVSILHKRIDMLQSQINSNLAAMSAQTVSAVGLISSHTHAVATSGGPTNQAGIAAPSGAGLSIKPPEPSATAETKYTTKIMDSTDLALFNSGIALAPLAIGTDLETLAANTQSMMNMASEA